MTLILIPYLTTISVLTRRLNLTTQAMWSEMATSFSKTTNKSHHNL